MNERQPEIQSGLRISAYNIRGLKGKMNIIQKLQEQTDVLGLCETWCRQTDHEVLEQMDEHVCTEPPHRQCRGFGGIAIWINPVIHYKVIDKQATKQHQHVSIQISNTTITVLYVSPSVKAKELSTILDGLNQQTRGQGIIIGDFNCRHKLWDKATNSKGLEIRRWTHKKKLDNMQPGPTNMPVKQRNELTRHGTSERYEQHRNAKNH